MMIQDIFIPTRLGSYYIFHKRVLGFEITTNCVQASLISFSRNAIVVENSMNVILADHNSATIVQAIKKIATTIGKYDEVVTSLTSSAVVFKELTLPFIGREKIKMIVNYEVEPLLPFSLDEAVIDFLVTQENKDTSQTTILVAAARKSDVDAYTSYFEKAGVTLHNVTLDMFALYDFYRHTMYVGQAYTSLLLVDFGIDAIRILYIQNGILKLVRLVPYGLVAMMNKIDTIEQDEMRDNLIKLLENKVQDQISEQLLMDFCKQINLSISFFAKQMKDFIAPAHMVCLGAGTQLQGFVDFAHQECHMPVEVLDMQKVIARNNIQVNKKVKIDGQYNSNLIIPLSATHYGDVNFLSHAQSKLFNDVLNKQLLVAVLLSITSILSFYFYSNYQLKKWNIAYEKSRRELVAVVKDQLDVDIKNSKRINEIVTAAQTKLEQEKKVCYSFSPLNNSILNHLQELFSVVDRESIGLDLKKISVHDKEIIIQGKIGPSVVQSDPYLNLDTFIEELMSASSFTLKNIPRDLSFTVTLLVKEDQQDEKE